MAAASPQTIDSAPTGSFDWPDDSVDKLRTMHLEGRSAAKIAVEIGHGISRSAVLGKIHRLGLRGVERKEKPKQGPAPRARIEAAPAARQAVKSAGVSASPPREAPKPKPPSAAAARASADIPPSGAITIHELRQGRCHWPFGDPRDDAFRYCGVPTGDPANPDCVYCAGHAAIAYAGKGRGR